MSGPGEVAPPDRPSRGRECLWAEAAKLRRDVRGGVASDLPAVFLTVGLLILAVAALATRVLQGPP